MCGSYEPLAPSLLPPLYVAYSTEISKPIQSHGDLRARFNCGDQAVMRAMHRFAELTVQALESLLAGDHAMFGALMNANFDLRATICTIPANQRDMIARARAAGATAAFSGSGGAIVGTFPEDATFARLEQTLGEISCKVIRPQVLPG